LDSGSSTSDFSSAFTPANFLAAQSGTSAFVLTSTPYYTSSLPDGPGASWLGTNSTAGTGVGDTALYAISFNLAAPVSSGSLNLYYAVDNALGYTLPGLYINGTALPDSTRIPGTSTGSFTVENNYTDANIGSLLVAGTNWLYFDAVNLGAPAGLIFSANITTSPSSPVTTPEPASVWLLCAGLMTVAAIRLRTARRS
jgi:hypothetical protein